MIRKKLCSKYHSNYVSMKSTAVIKLTSKNTLLLAKKVFSTKSCAAVCVGRTQKIPKDFLNDANANCLIHPVE